MVVTPSQLISSGLISCEGVSTPREEHYRCEELVEVGELAKSSREYGDEYASDVYDRACEESCRLGAEGCARMGRCRLEVTPDRRSRCFSAHYDNRRGVLHDVSAENQLTTIVSTARSAGLPQNDPIAIVAAKIEDAPDGGCPPWGLRAENYPVDGVHLLTLEALKRRIDNCVTKKRKKS